MVGARLTSVETVYEEQSWLFTVRDRYGELDEVILVPCEDGADEDDSGGDDEDDSGGDDEDDSENGAADESDVEAWLNRCTHEAQRLDRGFGAAMRDGEIVCPKHGSMFDACSGRCDNGDAAGTRLVAVDVAVEDGDVHLADDAYEFAYEGSVEDGESATEDDSDDDDMPSSTSHIGF